MTKYKKKPVVIEAKQLLFTTDSVKEICDWIGEKAKPFRDGNIIIETLEGNMMASTGDFIIKGIKGEFYPCKPDIFENTYEKLEK